MQLRNSAGEPCALVSNIQKYTIHDGPGIRTEIFFTGCTMRCLWCSNPETIAFKSLIGCYPGKCLSLDKCSWCVKSCPLQGAPLEFENGILKSIQMSSVCDTCFKCVHACPSQALKQWGELMTVEEMLKVIKEDSSFYRKTGGGVTLSGGEVMMQWEVAAMLLKACKESDINTCVETALSCPREQMEAVFEFTDLVITDIKHMNSEIHKSLTGVGNELILENIKRTVDMGKQLVIRTPVVPGYNGDEANMRASGAFIRDELQNKIVQYQLLPFRKLGTEKYDSLGIPYPLGDYQPPERSRWENDLTRYADMLVNEYGVPAVPGSSRKIVL